MVDRICVAGNVGPSFGSAKDLFTMLTRLLAVLFTRVVVGRAGFRCQNLVTGLLLWIG